MWRNLPPNAKLINDGAGIRILHFWTSKQMCFPCSTILSSNGSWCWPLSLTHVCSDIQLCPTVCNPMNYSPPGSSVHGIFQARILEWVAMPSSRGIFLMQGLKPCLLHLLPCRQSLPLSHQGSPLTLTCSDEILVYLIPSRYWYLVKDWHLFCR